MSWSEVISKSLDALQSVEKTFVVMPAMTVGAQFIEFEKKYSDRYIDVGIAEEHAATMSASLAHHGVKVFLPLYATFAQRAFDQILNDIARSNHHVVFGIDRAGLVGEDGPTHQGLYDVSMFNLMPNVVITMPYDANEAADLLYYGFMKQQNPFVIRYPRGLVPVNCDLLTRPFNEITPTWTYLKKGSKLALISYGPSLDLLIKASDSLGLVASIVNARFIKPIDEVMLKEVLDHHTYIFVYEEQSNKGSLYPQILSFMAKHGYKNHVKEMSITDRIVEHGHYKDILKILNMDQESIEKEIKAFYHEN
ncbi:MAG: transketolase C-terminal domain-containing protein [Acholeplasmataceae bacterium]|jgi:1-deoxy-D-xylulose-5-phosphate synthase|nr:transketolase C-terminal domain-containing protein [Acholeplasmataceae bacterium]